MAEGSTTWIDETRTAVDRAGNVEQARSEFENLGEVDERLDNALHDLAQLEQAAAMGQRSWWAGIDAPSDLWTELRSAQTNLARRQLQSVLRQLDFYRSRAREEARKAWRDHVASQAGDARELRELVRVLSGAPRLADVTPNLDQALGRLDRLQKDLPDADAVETLRKVVELLDTLEQRLPSAVKAFVSTAAHRGASLELLNAEVWGWLVDNGAVHNFRVVTGRPQEVPGG